MYNPAVSLPISHRPVILPISRPRFEFALILVAILCATGVANAQSLTGRVVDARTDAPVNLATVAVLRDGRTVTGTLTDENGDYRIRVPGSGVFTLSVSSQGYETVIVEEFALSNDPLTIQNFRLEPDPVRLQEVLVETSAGRLSGREKVRRRQLLGKGTFVSGPQLQDIGQESLTQYLAREADLEVRYHPWGFQYLRSPIGPSHCLVVQVNHWPLSTLGYQSLDEIRIDRIAAIEIYNTVSDVPPEEDLIQATRDPRLFPGENCGLVNVWFWHSWE